MNRYDICVIGAGPSGYAAAMRALDFNQKVLLVEKNKIGGAGIYQGALSSKTFWELSKDVATARKRVNKYMQGAFHVAYEDIYRDVHEAMRIRSDQLTINLEKNRRLTGEMLEYRQATARLISDHEIRLSDSSGIEETIWAEHIILATGSRPRTLPHIPVDGHTIVTSDGVENFRSFPKSIVILGAGVVGCEWATIFSNFGYTQVYIIDKADRILPFEDEDISTKISRNMEAGGIIIHRNAQLLRMEVVDGQVAYELQFKDGHREIFHVEKALISIGRIPNTENLGLEAAGVQVAENGTIPHDDCRTNVPNIYAVGDITADIALVNVGEMEGRHAVERIVGTTSRKLRYDNLSTIMFLNPETAGVGINEQTARAQKLPYRVAGIDYSLIPRAIAMKNHDGFFKILTTHDDEMKILGMRAVGVHASSAIEAIALLISMDKGIEELADLLHPHPSIIEGIQECVRMLKGKSILNPEIFSGLLTCKAYDAEGNCTDYFRPGC